MGNKITKEKLGSKIWAAANHLRDKLEAYEYKDYVLGLILYKFLCEKQSNYLIKNWVTKEQLKYLDSKYLDNISNFSAFYTGNNLESDYEIFKDAKKECIDENGYFIDYSDLFIAWLENKSSFNIQDFQQAFNNFNNSINDAHKSLFKDLFVKFERDLSKLGSDTNEQTKVISSLLDIINDIPSTNQDYDVLGYIYEYLIARFASSAGKKAGEFYTPHEVSELMSKIVAHHLKDREVIKVYDPTSGSGSLLLTIGQEFKKYNSGNSPVSYYAQELKAEVFNLTRMNLIMKNISPTEIHARNGDTLEQDWPMFENNDYSSYQHLSVDAVVSNPPYSQKWNAEKHTLDPRYIEYGIAPKTKADYAFLLHDLYHVQPDGIITIVLPHGVLFRGNSEGQIRKTLIQKQQIDTIIGLPANMFYGTGIPTIIMILKKHRSEKDILFVDASKLYVKEGKNNKFSKSHIKKIADVVNNRIEIENFSRRVLLDEIVANDYNLNISRYIDNFKKQEQHDLYSLMHGGISKEELAKLDNFFDLFTGLKGKLFKINANNYYELKVAKEDINSTIKGEWNVSEYINSFDKKSTKFLKFFKNFVTSVEQIEHINLVELESALTDYIFENMDSIPLVDAYDIYQIFVNNFDLIKDDIELISKYYQESEDKSNVLSEILNGEIEKLETKSKKSATKGYKSNIFDNELIQEKFFSDKYWLMRDKSDESESLKNELEELEKSISEEEKTDEIYDFEANKFKHENIEKAYKSMLKDIDSLDQESIEFKLTSICLLRSKISKVDKDKKELSNFLDEESYNKYISLSSDEFYELLIEKWLTPVIEQINQIGINFVEDFISKIESLAEKYSDTLEDINDQIVASERELVELLKDLKGEESDMKAIDELIKILGGK
ncbi:Putative type I restriction enzyme MpnORFDP M protein [Mycoplasmopsis agalactiae]|uniref:type I restriction-modification system subunit M n=1 Tax=Mycoplasmopsis agalactiae TaxID=2110 RepID=UPI000C702235|nr:type I restriction-modification system subunit M [Mycoplasmopsis agalactiae]MCE6057306.1 type I restriction-modification system subunit M [Mycoplasmopsis agalactiae]MCE6079091.1 type I restriction-modification system subunit M [Mycoplasmopsis agalactiae]MCE6095477.1 type I restriction-modification system subunit M [Mycoplasmopsis agalactiae]MCE6114732.1 type I restriction-modification system subunit M [Mycoplasmopsis agalactiae]SBO45028.1 Putative type I restriction enzyme MpnORFDP M protei